MAILNFVFGAGGIFGGMWNIFMAVAGDRWPSPASYMRLRGGQAPSAFLRLAEEMTPTPAYLWAMGILGMLGGVLLIVSGLGYLKRKRVSGWLVAHIYAAVSVITVVVGVALSRWGWFAISGLTYPVLTVILLNTMLKKHFVN